MNPPQLVVLGLGSNKGDSRLIILSAIKALKAILGDLKAASFYETDPLHVIDQAPFINTVVCGLSSLQPGELLVSLQGIEARFGRNRQQERRWGERTLDIDILLFGEEIVQETDLVIPHPRLNERRFALEPLLELLPCAVDPATLRPYKDICQALPFQGIRKIANVCEFDAV